MSRLTARHVRALERLLRTTRSMTLGALAGELGVSSRTLQRDLPVLAAWLQGLGIGLHVRTRLGLQVEAGAGQREEALAALGALSPAEELSPEERQSLLLQELLQEPSGAKLAYWARRLGVTEGTVSHDLDRLEPWLRDRNLTLVRRPGFGIELQGDERHLRAAIIDFLRRNQTDEQVYEMLRHGLTAEAAYGDGGFMAHLFRFVDEERLRQIVAAVLDLSRQLANPLADSAVAGLVVHLSLAVERLRTGEAIQFPGDLLEQLRLTREWSWASQLVEQVSEALSITIPADEIGYVTMHLKGARMQGAPVLQGESDADREEALSLARAMAQRAEVLLGAPIGDAPGLIQGLAIHLLPTISRLRMGLEIRNPLLSQMQAEFPELLAASRRVCHLLAGHLGLPVSEEEAGYVAMHLGAALERLRSQSRILWRAVLVCPTGVGSSQLLAGRLGYRMPEIEVMGVVPALDLPAVIATLQPAPDLVLSTVALEYRGLPVAVVSPLLRDDDVARVRRLLGELRPGRAGWQAALPEGRGEPGPEAGYLRAPHRGETTGSARPGDGAYGAATPEAIARRAAVTGPFMLALLERFRLQPLGDREPVAAVVSLLEAAGLPHNPGQVTADLHRREALGPTMVDERLQLLHARTDGVGAPWVGLLCSPRRTVLVMLAPARTEPEALELLGAISVALVERPDLVDALHRGEERSIRELIGRLLQGVIFAPPRLPL